jgi:hypothetical protein
VSRAGYLDRCNSYKVPAETVLGWEWLFLRFADGSAPNVSVSSSSLIGSTPDPSSRWAKEAPPGPAYRRGPAPAASGNIDKIDRIDKNSLHQSANPPVFASRSPYSKGNFIHDRCFTRPHSALYTLKQNGPPHVPGRTQNEPFNSEGVPRSRYELGDVRGPAQNILHVGSRSGSGIPAHNLVTDKIV